MQLVTKVWNKLKKKKRHTEWNNSPCSISIYNNQNKGEQVPVIKNFCGADTFAGGHVRIQMLLTRNM